MYSNTYALGTVRLPAFSTTLRTIIQQAWPVLISQWAIIAFGTLDTVMIGHTSPNDLAAISLSNSLYMLVLAVGVGIIYALIPILAQHYGANRLEDIGKAWGQGVWLALPISGLGILAVLFPDPWLSLAGEVSPAIRTISKNYLQAVMPALLATLLFKTIYAFCAAVSHTKSIMMITVGGVVLKAFFNWLFIYGHGGFPALGAPGAGLSSSLVAWISLGMGLWLITHDPFYQRFSPYLGKPQWHAQKQLLSFGIPMGASYLVEESAFNLMAVIIAPEGAYILGGHEILASIADVCYMVPLSIGIATAALTAQALGNHHHALARHIGGAGFMLTFLAVGFITTLIWNVAPFLLKIYTSHPPIAYIVSQLLPVFPIYHFCDSLHCFTIYLLRAYQIAVAPLIIQAMMLGGVGIVGGWWLGFGPQAGKLDPLRTLLMPEFPAGAGTVWFMATLGLGVSALLLIGWYWKLTRTNQ